MFYYFGRCAALDAFRKAYQDSLFTDSRLASSVKKILKFKYRAGLNSVKPINITNLYKDLNSTKNEALNYELYENAITVLKNTNAVLPIKDLAKEDCLSKNGRCNKRYIFIYIKNIRK
jgi:beta-glucosidase-like glycosyl hydrolase